MKWFNDAFFYHIYPLGFCSSEKYNDRSKEIVYGLDIIYQQIEHLKDLGVNAVFFGPIFQSESHGYDTSDYFNIDRRLGSNESFKNIVKVLHENGMRVIVDGVFNHSGRDFFAFKDLLHNKWDSKYKDWYHNVDFGKSNHYNDPFSYYGWAGNINLVKYNLKNDEVVNHLLEAVRFWISEYDIDGIRLDAADELDHDFLKRLSAFTKGMKKDFFLKGEVVHGNYANWANDEKLHATTNYECYKGLYSSLNDNNYFEIAYALKRQFGDGGIYKDLPLYNFADNHDVDRVASSLKKKEHLYPLYGLLFTMPGIPSVYYGSEWGMQGKRSSNSDHELRPDWVKVKNSGAEKDLCNSIKRFAELRKNLEPLRYGNYKEIFVSSNILMFERNYNGKKILVALNSDSSPKQAVYGGYNGKKGYDLLNNQHVEAGSFSIPGNWLRIIEL